VVTVVNDKVGVLILCGNRLLRESIARIVSKKSDLQLIAARPAASVLREEISESDADVLVTDSLRFVLEDAACFPKSCTDKRALKCVLVSMGEHEEHFLTAVRRGVLGYVLQEASAADVVAAIRTVAAGDAVCPQRFARILFDSMASRADDVPRLRARDEFGLTRREQQLIPLIGRGLTNKEIANQLNLSEQTIKSHIHRILRKVGVEDRLSILDVWQNQAVAL
jgi:DNA-binding NarL/FixJ family response regulator